MSNSFYPHDRFLEEREYLLCKLAEFEDSKNLDAWHETWLKLSEIDRILELNP